MRLRRRSENRHCRSTDPPQPLERARWPGGSRRRWALAYLDTGLLYRAVGRRVLEANASAVRRQQPLKPAASALVTPGRPAERDGPAWARGGLALRAWWPPCPAVRAALLEFQRAVAPTDGAVLDGRDIGTVVVPRCTPEAVRHSQRWRYASAAAMARTASTAAWHDSARSKSRQNCKPVTCPRRPAAQTAPLAAASRRRYSGHDGAGCRCGIREARFKLCETGSVPLDSYPAPRMCAPLLQAPNGSGPLRLGPIFVSIRSAHRGLDASLTPPGL